jgi:hypothetical protein
MKRKNKFLTWEVDLVSMLQQLLQSSIQRQQHHFLLFQGPYMIYQMETIFWGLAPIWLKTTL